MKDVKVHCGSVHVKGCLKDQVKDKYAHQQILWARLIDAGKRLPGEWAAMIAVWWCRWAMRKWGSF